MALVVGSARTAMDGESMTDFAYEEGRWEPPVAGDEDATLLGFLERQRATFAWKTEGLDADNLRATLGSSAITLGGMLKHLARFEDDMSTEWLHGREQLPLTSGTTTIPARSGAYAACASRSRPSTARSRCSRTCTASAGIWSS
jgi:hypothetical protein